MVIAALLLCWQLNFLLTCPAGTPRTTIRRVRTKRLLLAMQQPLTECILPGNRVLLCNKCIKSSSNLGYHKNAILHTTKNFGGASNVEISPIASSKPRDGTRISYSILQQSAPSGNHFCRFGAVLFINDHKDLDLVISWLMDHCENAGKAAQIGQQFGKASY